MVVCCLFFEVRCLALCFWCSCFLVGCCVLFGVFCAMCVVRRFVLCFAV